MSVNLTLEQIKSIQTYWMKWQTITLSTEPINQENALKAVNLLYRSAERNEPKIIFAESPARYYAQAFLSSMLSASFKEALEKHLRSKPENLFIIDQRQKNIAGELSFQLKLPVEQLVRQRVKRVLEKTRQGESTSEARLKADAEIYNPEALRQIEQYHQMDSEFAQQYGTSTTTGLSIPESCAWIGAVYRTLHSRLELPQELLIKIADTGFQAFNGTSVGCIDCCLLAFANARFDYCISVLDFPDDPRWEILQALIQCGGPMIFPYEETCIICARPCVLSLDNQQRLHAEASPAIQFTDKFSIYAFCGVLLPEKYGKLPLSQWQPEWIIAERDHELRRILIQEIGYARIFQELPGKELGNWREYTLLEWSGINRVLRKIDPNTGEITVWEMPWFVESLDNALRWLHFPQKDLSKVPTKHLLWLSQHQLYCQSSNIAKHLSRRAIQAIKDWNHKQPTQATQFSISNTLIIEITGGACRGIWHEFAQEVAEYNKSLRFPKLDNLSPKRVLGIQSLAEIISIQDCLG